MNSRGVAAIFVYSSKIFIKSCSTDKLLLSLFYETKDNSIRKLL